MRFFEVIEELLPDRDIGNPDRGTDGHFDNRRRFFDNPFVYLKGKGLAPRDLAIVLALDRVVIRRRLAEEPGPDADRVAAQLRRYDMEDFPDPDIYRDAAAAGHAWGDPHPEVIRTRLGSADPRRELEVIGEALLPPLDANGDIVARSGDAIAHAGAVIILEHALSGRRAAPIATRSGACKNARRIIVRFDLPTSVAQGEYHVIVLNRQGEALIGEITGGPVLQVP